MSTEQILEIKETLRLSPKEFAARYGASRRQFYNWISRKNHPSTATLILMKIDLEKITESKRLGSQVLLINRN